MKLTWVTDIHLNFLTDNARKAFYKSIVSTQSDAVLISGDIAEAPGVNDYLIEMEKSIKKPIYFVLGNHDYYHGEISEVRKKVTSLCKLNENLFWLPAYSPQQLNDEVILLGQDGWADGRLGDYTHSRLEMNDSRLIENLSHKRKQGKVQLLKKMQQLADADALQLKDELKKALRQQPAKIIILTHIPPFKEASHPRYLIKKEHWWPFYCSKIMGETIDQIAMKHSSVEYLVLCGHSHRKADFHPLDNLTIRTGQAEYFHPEIQDILSV
ncbi:metallophosphoesterase [Legionella israelensis]|uniref:Metallophosphoesterase n=1 Tax=Legionella israelensis TaxID=454 RepID=A0AAX1EDE8_9GAMM|nr:metallophosphoesterase [Legionella israelensis]QBR82887.1 metallophosphoesterase [Legionella israelensis]